MRSCMCLSAVKVKAMEKCLLILIRKPEITNVYLLAHMVYGSSLHKNGHKNGQKNTLGRDLTSRFFFFFPYQILEDASSASGSFHLNESPANLFDGSKYTKFYSMKDSTHDLWKRQHLSDTRYYAALGGLRT